LFQSAEETPVFLFMKGNPDAPQVCVVWDRGSVCCATAPQRIRACDTLTACTYGLGLRTLLVILSLQCGFSNQVCRILHLQGVKFNAFNVLADADIREGIKAYS
jgi:glutaredoxin-related protein